jgi:hypothetical protein
VADIQRTRKRQRSIGDPNGDSDKENLRTLSTHKSKRPRKGRNAVQLLENAVQLSQKAVNLSQEAICLSQTVVSLLDKED